MNDKINLNARRCGRTTAAIQAAPLNSIYVCVNSHNIGYVRHLAKHLGRTDLQFTSPSELERALCGTTRKVVVDHAAELGLAAREALHWHAQKANDAAADYAIFDLDNCIADDAWRMPFINWSPGLTPDERYSGYHNMCYGDEPRNKDVVQVMQDHGVKLVFFTARSVAVRKQTQQWLQKHFGIVDPTLIMRAVSDFVPSVILKAQMLERFRSELRPNDRIIAAFDDRQDIVDMYISHGIPATLLKVHDVCAYTNPATMEQPNGI